MSSSSNKSQPIELLFDGGMDQRSHPKQLQPPGCLSVVNARWRNSGGIQKRFGTRRIATGFRGGYSMVPGQAKVVGFRSELLALDGFRIGSMAVGGDVNPWFVDKGKIPEATSRSRPVDTTQYNVIGPDMVYSQGLMFHAWLGGANFNFNVANEVFSTVEDVQTGALILSSVKISTGTGPYYTPHIVAVSNRVYLYYRDSLFTAGPNIYYHEWNFTTMQWGARVTLRTDSAGDIALTTDGDTYIYLVHKNTANELVLFRYDFTMTQLSTITCSEPASTALGLGLGICVTPSEFVFMTFNRVDATSEVKYACYDTGLFSESLAPTTVHTTAGTFVFSTAPVRVAFGQALIAIGSASLSYFPTWDSTGAPVGTSTDVNRTANWVTVASKPFIASTSPLRVMCWVIVGGANLNSVSDTVNTYTYMLVDLRGDDTATAAWAARPVTWESPRYTVVDGVIGAAAFWAPPSVAQISDNVFDSDFVVRRNARTRTGLYSARADFRSPDRYATCELGQTLFMSPGFYWDKDKLAEIGFAYYPQKINVNVSTTGGTWGATTRTFIAMYEYIDANGYVHRSLPSAPFEATSSIGTTNSFIIQVPALTVTQRQDARLTNDANAVRVVIYVLNTGTGVFNRLFVEGQEGVNDPKLRIITVTDTGTGLATDPREILYKQSGVFGNVMPNAFTACCTYRNRVWVAYRNIVSYSKSFVTGESVSFADEFELPLEENGNITAMWAMDDTLYISTADRIYYLQADGPNDFGQQSDINTPNQVATDRGVIDQRSVAVTPIGTLYQSSVGIQLLDRGRTVQQEPIGSRVQDDLAFFDEIVSTNVHPTGRYVSFSCRSFVGLGLRLVFDYALNRWSRDVLWASPGSLLSGVAIYSETICNGVVYSAINSAPNTSVIAEDTSTHLDNGEFVTMAVELAQMHPAGLQARIAARNWQFFNDRQSDHDLLLRWYVNYETTPFATQLWTSDKLAALAQREQVGKNVAMHQVQSIRVTVLDAPPTGPGAVLGNGRGATFLGITVDIENINQTQRLPAPQKS